MFKDARQEYSVKTCPTSDAEALEGLLNSMSEEGWDLYTMSEAEAKNGQYVYNCIFMREADDEKSEDDEVCHIDVGDFRSKMEKIFQKDPYLECREIQSKIKQKRERIAEIKACLDSTVIDDSDRAALNEEINRALGELETLKGLLVDVISPDKFYEKLDIKKLTILLSEEIIELVNPDNNAELISQSVKVRQELSDKLGYVIPAIQFKTDDTLEAGQYKINVRDITTLEGQIYPEYKMFYKKDLDLSKKPSYVIEDEDIISGEKVWWIPLDKTEKYWAKGLLPHEVIAQNMKYVARRYVDDIFDYNDVNKFIEIAAEKNIYLVENIMPDFLSVGELRYILATLIRENVPVKDVIFIFEKINDFSDDAVKDDLFGKIRMSLSRQICASIADENRNIYGITLDAATVAKIQKALDSEESTVTIKGGFLKKTFRNIENILKTSHVDIENTAVIVPLEIRQIVFHIVEQFIPNLSVIANQELSSEFNVEIIGEA
ncbi:MAG: FHIPEP family type III secretion protein [Candidatus Gastranaerophilales bacterium]|nr:FHIPEP family type III secretion protein [Candidatus Gastranaerophilales bacterium]